MNEENASDTWSVDAGGEIYKGDLAELVQWIAEGSLLPADRVRKGNLRWIDAIRVPALVPHFNAKANGTVIEPSASVTVASASEINKPTPSVQMISRPAAAGFCRVHSDIEATYICDGCAAEFCKSCPNTYGSVKICPLCGGMCRATEQVAAEKRKDEKYELDVTGGFGLSDLTLAFAYPFKFKTSLFLGALMFMFFSLGRSATALGGIIMFGAAIICMMLANMLTFGVLANTVENFSQGKIGGNFMPDFDEFSLWEDVVHPFFLSIGVYISSFGIFLVVAVVGMYFVMSSLAAQSVAMKGQLEKLPGTAYYDTQRTIQQSDQVRKVVSSLDQQAQQRFNEAENASNSQPQPTSADTEAGVMRANEQIQKDRLAELESTIGKTPETKQKDSLELIKAFMSLAAPVVVISFIALIWGLFYFPAACAVAGYTRSFTATINPLVGLDTIRRLGIDYAKLLAMSLLILICSGIIGSFFGLVLSAFDLPSFGNLPAKALASLFGFYFTIVFSCLIGFALYKASDRLKLLK